MFPRQSTRSFATALVLFVLAIHVKGMTYRDNQVMMPLSASGYTIVSATYTITGFSITNGQDPDNHIYAGLANTYTGNNGSMTFSIGREGSGTVATWFSSQIPGSRNTFNSTPSDLNFAFLGTLKMTLTGGVLGSNSDTYTLNGIALAQEGTVTSNNWWFGGTNCNYNPSATNTVSCSGTSTAGYGVTFSFQRGGSNTVNLTSITYPPYTLFSVAPKYVGENVGWTWQLASSKAICPPYVLYYNSTQSASLQVTVKANLLYYAGVLFDTSKANPSHSGVPAAIFVMSSTGTIYASNRSVTFLFHHSTLLGGVPVASAGELIVRSGVIQTMTNCSGHYLPTSAAYLQLVEALHRQGYTRSFTFNSCSPSMLKYP